MDAAAWDAIRPNLGHLGEAADWWRVVMGPIAPPDLPEEDRAFVARAAEALAVAWNETPTQTLTAGLKETTGRKGKALFLPLRLALTGREHGPDMGALLPLIGQAAAADRLRAASH